MNAQEQFQNTFSVFELPQERLQEVLHMEKLTNIIQSTGLTESQIGLYIKEKLIHPAAEAQKHFRAGVLLEEEACQLKAVQCLRVHAFGLEEIKYLTVCADAAQAYLQKKSEEKLMLYRNMEDVQEAIGVLQSHCPEGKELAALKRDVRRYAALPKDPNYKPTWWENHYPAVILTGILAILLAGLFVKMQSLAAKVLLVLALMAIGALLALGSCVVYLVRRKPPKAYSHKGMAVVEKVDRVTGFDTSFAMGKSIVPGSGFREQGQGGVWQFVFMFWNEIRPDHYFPIVRFSHNGQERIATFRFGGFKHFLKVGDRIPVYWSDEDDGIVYPENTSFMVQKSLAALCIGVLLGGFFCAEIGPVFRAANSDILIDDLQSVLFGGSSEVYEGTQTAGERELHMEFTQFTGVRRFELTCRKGEYIYVENEDWIEEGQNIQFIYSIMTGAGQLMPSLRQDAPVYKAAFPIHKDGIYTLEITAHKAAGTFHAVVCSGLERMEEAANALNALADSDSLALKAISTSEKEKETQTETTLYYDCGRYYQRTEVSGGDVTTIQESLFDGTSGWSRIYNQGEAETEWVQSPTVPPVPAHMDGARKNARKLLENPENYKSYCYLDGEFTCSMTDEYLSSLLADVVRQLETMRGMVPEAQQESIQKMIEQYLATTYTWGYVTVKVDEATGKAVLFDSYIAAEEQQEKGKVFSGTRSIVEVIPEADPKAEIEKYLGQV